MVDFRQLLREHELSFPALVLCCGLCCSLWTYFAVFHNYFDPVQYACLMAVGVVLYVLFIYLLHQVRSWIPRLVEANTHCDIFRRACCFVSGASWAGIGCCSLYVDELRKVEARTGRTAKDSRLVSLFFVAISCSSLVLSYYLRFALKAAQRKRERSLRNGVNPVHESFIHNIYLIVATFTIKISVAFWFCYTSCSPTVAVLVGVGAMALLYLLLVEQLEACSLNLEGSNGKILQILVVIFGASTVFLYGNHFDPVVSKEVGRVLCVATLISWLLIVHFNLATLEEEDKAKELSARAAIVPVAPRNLRRAVAQAG